MHTILIVGIVVVIFALINFLYYKCMKRYVKRAFGPKWLDVHGNKVYFWQSAIFVSTIGTVLIVYTLQWMDILTVQ